MALLPLGRCRKGELAMRMKASSRRVATLTVGVLIFAVTGCAVRRDRETVRQGLLVTGLDRRAFLAEWGIPETTYTLTGGDTMQAGWGGGGGFFFKGRVIYDVWVYQSRGVELVFDHYHLVTWKKDPVASPSAQGLRSSL